MCRRIHIVRPPTASEAETRATPLPIVKRHDTSGASIRSCWTRAASRTWSSSSGREGGTRLFRSTTAIRPLCWPARTGQRAAVRSREQCRRVPARSLGQVGRLHIPLCDFGRCFPGRLRLMLSGTDGALSRSAWGRSWSHRGELADRVAMCSMTARSADAQDSDVAGTFLVLYRGPAAGIEPFIDVGASCIPPVEASRDGRSDGEHVLPPADSSSSTVQLGAPAPHRGHRFVGEVRCRVSGDAGPNRCHPIARLYDCSGRPGPARISPRFRLRRDVLVDAVKILRFGAGAIVTAPDQCDRQESGCDPTNTV